MLSICSAHNSSGYFVLYFYRRNDVQFALLGNVSEYLSLLNENITFMADILNMDTLSVYTSLWQWLTGLSAHFVQH